MNHHLAQAREEFRKALKSLITKCYYCDKIATTVDHALPVSRGGKDIPENWRPACSKCNGDKGSLTELEFLGFEKPILCNCYKAFNSTRDRDAHMKAKNCEPRIRCSCRRLFQDVRALTDHLKIKGCDMDSEHLFDSTRHLNTLNLVHYADEYDCLTLYFDAPPSRCTIIGVLQSGLIRSHHLPVENFDYKRSPNAVSRRAGLIRIQVYSA